MTLQSYKQGLIDEREEHKEQLQNIRIKLEAWLQVHGGSYGKEEVFSSDNFKDAFDEIIDIIDTEIDEIVNSTPEELVADHYVDWAKGG